MQIRKSYFCDRSPSKQIANYSVDIRTVVAIGFNAMTETLLLKHGYIATSSLHSSGYDVRLI